MPKRDFGTVIGTCEICNMNIWDSTGGKPAIWPCNLDNCPYEEAGAQHSHHGQREFSYTGSGLGQID
jgi:hypothetical protein